MPEWVGIIITIGLLIALSFFIWKKWQREQRQKELRVNDKNSTADNAIEIVPETVKNVGDLFKLKRK